MTHQTTDSPTLPAPTSEPDPLVVDRFRRRVVAVGLALSAATVAGLLATSPALPDAAGRALLGLAAEQPDHGIVLVMLGFLTYTVGTVAAVAGLLRSRAVPILAPIVFLVLTVLPFVGISGRVLDLVQLAQMIMVVGLAGWVLTRR